MSTATAPKASGIALATGRRKTAIARVRIKAGSGKIVINGRELDDYFPTVKDKFQVLDALNQTGKVNLVDVSIHVHGGGPTGQAGPASSVWHGRYEFSIRSRTTCCDTLGLLTRDGRMKERKKYGLRGARRGTQFSKR